MVFFYNSGCREILKRLPEKFSLMPDKKVWKAGRVATVFSIPAQVYFGKGQFYPLKVVF